MNSTVLLIMRHAKSNWKTGGKDFDRTLSDRGRKDAARMGQWIVDNGYTPDVVFCSPAQRVWETISLAGQNWGQDEAAIQWLEQIYNADLPHLLSVIAHDLSVGKVNLLVGHNPGVSELLLYLSANQVPAAARPNLMPTSALAVLQCPDETAMADYGSWKVTNYMKPKLLQSR